MVDAGYPKNYSVALSVVTSTLAMIIPPSIPMVIYAVAASESVGRVLAAGLVPGIVFGLMMMVVNHWKAIRQGSEGDPRFAVRRVVATLRDGFWALLTPIVILGGIFSGGRHRHRGGCSRRPVVHSGGVAWSTSILTDTRSGRRLGSRLATRAASSL